LFNKYGVVSQAQKTEIGIVVMLGLTTAFLFDYSYSNFGKKAFPYRCFSMVPGQFLKLFLKTIGVVKDCLSTNPYGVVDRVVNQSFNPEWQAANRDESMIYDLGRISENSFGVDHNSFLMILIFAIAGSKRSDLIQFGRNSIGHAFKENKTEDHDLTNDRRCANSGKIPVIRYSNSRKLIPVGSLAPLKQTGLYEKGDCN
jgi:hypothetical protein